MNTLISLLKSRRLIKTLALSAVALPLSMSVAGTALAEDCQPLQVSRILPTHVQGSPESVSFLVEGFVLNRNPDVYNGSNRAFVDWYYKDHTGKITRFQKEVFDTHIAPKRGKERIVANNKYTVSGNPDPSSWIVDFGGVIINEQCSDQKKRIAISKFRYDFNPVRRGGKPRFIRGSIRTHLDDGARVRPRAGRGAPKPRT